LSAVLTEASNASALVLVGHPDQSEQSERAKSVIMTIRATRGRKDLGQLRASEAGTGSESPSPNFLVVI